MAVLHRLDWRNFDLNASSFEAHRFAMLHQDEVSYQTLMVRSASSRVSNHEASGEATMIRVNRKTL